MKQNEHSNITIEKGMAEQVWRCYEREHNQQNGTQGKHSQQLGEANQLAYKRKNKLNN